MGFRLANTAGKDDSYCGTKFGDFPPFPTSSCGERWSPGMVWSFSISNPDDHNLAPPATTLYTKILMWIYIFGDSHLPHFSVYTRYRLHLVVGFLYPYHRHRSPHGHRSLPRSPVTSGLVLDKNSNDLKTLAPTAAITPCSPPLPTLLPQSC